MMATEQITGERKAAILKQFGGAVAEGRRKIARQRAAQRARRRKPPSKSGLRRNPIPKKAPKTAAQNRQFQQDKARIQKASIAESERVRAERIVINERRAAAGRRTFDVPPAFTPGTFVQPNRGIHGIPEAKPPTLFKQEFTGPSSPPAQERPLPPFISPPLRPGIPGAREAITGKEMQQILTAAGIRVTPTNPRNVSAKSAIDPYSVFFN